MTRLVCSGCGAKYKVDDSAAARAPRCPKCKGKLVSPAEAEASIGLMRDSQLRAAQGAPLASDPISPDAPTVVQSDAPLELSFEDAPPAVAAPTGVPRQIGDVRIEKRLGKGGMGTVYLGWQQGIERKVAVKVLDLPEGAAGAKQRARLEREIRTVGALEHPNIVHVHTSGAFGGTPYYVMDFVAGRELGDYARRSKPGIERRVEIVRDAALAVHYAHGKGVIHRDLKPANLMVADSGDVRLLDFGLAKDLTNDAQLSLEGDIMGTPGFMAPEQAEGSGVDLRADVYGLGAVLFWLCAGRAPHEGPTVMATILAVTKQPAPDVRELAADVPADLAAVIDKALAIDPARRYPSAAALARDLSSFLAGEPVSARERSQLAKLVDRFKRGQLSLPAVGGVVGAVLVLALALSWLLGPSRIQRLALAVDDPATQQTAYGELLEGVRAETFVDDELSAALDAIKAPLADPTPPALQTQLLDHLAVNFAQVPVRERLYPHVADRLVAWFPGLEPERQVALLEMAGLSRLRPCPFKDVALDALKQRDHVEVRRAAAIYFSRVPSIDALSTLQASVWDPEIGEQAMAATREVYGSGVLGMTGGGAAGQAVAGLQQKLHAQQKKMQAMIDQMEGRKPAHEDLIERFSKGKLEDRRRWLLVAAHDPPRDRGPKRSVARALVEVLQRTPELASEAAMALHKLGAGPSKAPLIELLRHADARVRLGAARALMAVEGDDVTQALREAFKAEPPGEAREGMMTVREQRLSNG